MFSKRKLNSNLPFLKEGLSKFRNNNVPATFAEFEKETYRLWNSLNSDRSDNKEFRSCSESLTLSEYPKWRCKVAQRRRQRSTFEQLVEDERIDIFSQFPIKFPRRDDDYLSRLEHCRNSLSLMFLEDSAMSLYVRSSWAYGTNEKSDLHSSWSDEIILWSFLDKYIQCGPTN